MSDGCHANTSTFARRKAMSALSYLGSRVALMVKVPPVPSSLADTFLVSGGAAIVFLHLPVELDGASSTVAQHSEEVRLPEWASELLPDEHLWGLSPFRFGGGRRSHEEQIEVKHTSSLHSFVPHGCVKPYCLSWRCEVCREAPPS